MPQTETTTEPTGTSGEQPERWVMPAWMEPYRSLIVNTGGNDIEELANDLLYNKQLMITNTVRCSLAMTVWSQIGLLINLRHAGHLSNLEGQER